MNVCLHVFVSKDMVTISSSSSNILKKKVSRKQSSHGKFHVLIYFTVYQSTVPFPMSTEWVCA